MYKYTVNPHISLFKIKETLNPGATYCINAMNGKLFKIGEAAYRFLEKEIKSTSDTIFAPNEVQLENSLRKNFLIFPKSKNILEMHTKSTSFLLNHINQICFKDFTVNEKKANISRYESVPLDKVRLFGNFKTYSNEFHQKPINQSSIPSQIQDIVRTTFSKQGETDWEVPNLGKGNRRTSPSNGGRHPIELYLLSHNIEGVQDAIFHFSSLDEQLTLIAKEKIDYTLNELLSIPNDHPFFCLFYVANFPRSQLRYNESRSLLSVFLDCGHLIGTVDMLANLYALEHTDASFSPKAFQRITQLSSAYDGVIYASILSSRAIKRELFKNNLDTTCFHFQRVLSLLPDFQIWEQTGWIGAAYIYTMYTSIMDQFYDNEIFLSPKIKTAGNNSVANLKKHLYARRTCRKFENNHQISYKNLEIFIISLLSNFYLDNIKLIIAFNRKNDKNTGFYEYDFSTRSLHYISDAFPLPYIKREFNGQIDCENFIISFHFFYVECKFPYILSFSDFNVILTLLQIGSIAQNLIIQGMSLQLESFMTHASRNSPPFLELKMVDDNCTLLYSIIMGTIE